MGTSVSVIALLMSLIMLLGGLLLGSAVQAMLLRLATWLLRRVAGRRVNTTHGPSAAEAWHAEPPVAPPQVPTDLDIDGANPYSVATAEPAWTAPPQDTGIVPMPSFGHAILITLIANVISIALVFVFQWLPALLGIGGFLVHPVVPIVLQLVSFVTVLRWRLPTNWGWAVALAFIMFLIAVALILVVIVPVMLLPTIFFG